MCLIQISVYSISHLYSHVRAIQRISLLQKSTLSTTWISENFAKLPILILTEASNGWKKSLALNYFSTTLPYLHCQFATMQDDATTLCLRNLCYYYCGECVRVHCAH